MPQDYEMLRKMRTEGNTLREIGETVGVSRERVRQILAQCYGGAKILLLPESRVEDLIGCSRGRLARLRENGIINPKHTSWFWLYDRDEIEKAMLALQRSCPYCGKLLPLKTQGKYCSECSRERMRYHYPFLSEEAKRQNIERTRRWHKGHPERTREINIKARAKYREKKRLEKYQNPTLEQDRGV